MDLKNTSYGIEIRFEKFHIVFGNRSLTKDDLSSKFSTYKFQYLKQVHGDQILNVDNSESSGEKVADAHFTLKTLTAPVIATADCLPVAIVAGEKVAVIHAGWRGVEQNIIGKSIRAMEIKDPSKAHVFIGPHIHFDSFEVHKDVAQKLLLSYEATGFQQLDQVIFRHVDPAKNFVDLSVIARAQIAAAGLSLSSVWISDIDTVTTKTYASFRRDGAAAGGGAAGGGAAGQGNAGRQYSFAVRLP